VRKERQRLTRQSLFLCHSGLGPESRLLFLFILSLQVGEAAEAIPIFLLPLSLPKTNRPIDQNG